MIFAVIDGSLTYQWGPSLVVALIAILMVFSILLLIIGITFGIFKGIEAFNKNKRVEAVSTNGEVHPTSFNDQDEDMVAAVMVATIDYQNEIKEDVKLVSIKEIK